MKLKTSILFGLLSCGSYTSAQNLNLDILPPSVTIQQDSVILSINMTVSAPYMDAKKQIRLIPILSGEGHSAEMPRILLNGERTHRLYRRTQAFNKRKGKKDVAPVFTAIALTGDSHTIAYRASLPAAEWIAQADLSIRKEVIDENGNKIQNENIPIPGKKTNIITPTQDRIRANSPTAPLADPIVLEHRPVLSTKQHFKGSYISPESDATDERNQKELNFSLDEARVIADINPQMLSLRELYTVAISYKSNPDQFYKVIDISVKIYPASPVANLNAAAAAIEQGNTQAAGRYLQMASHETLAYKNCRGAYELLCNNTYEGIRLLKAAKAEGSEEATHNLKVFFESNKNNMP